MTTESKIVATERLRSEGRWEEASLYRDEQRRRLREEGMTRREAREESWRLTLKKYPPAEFDELCDPDDFEDEDDEDDDDEDEEEEEEEEESLERTKPVRKYGVEKIFSVRAVAEQYGVHPQTVRRWITEGVDGGRILGSRKIGGRRYIGENDLGAWLMDGYEPPPESGKRDQESEELEPQSAGVFDFESYVSE